MIHAVAVGALKIIGLWVLAFSAFLAAEGGADYTGMAFLVTSISTLIAAIATAFIALRTHAAVSGVHNEVRTLNDKTLGQLGNEGETRRVEGIPHDERTAMEQRHVDQAPPEEPPQGPGR